jgi:radical SAM superfamily enzyme YgiQ (UPF0313 family)
MGIAYIGAALLRAGEDVIVTDASLNDLSIDETVEQALRNDPHVVGVGFTTPIYHRAQEIAAEVKKRSPGTVVVFGGPHASALPEATLRQSKVDFITIGEGEESMPGIVRAVREKKDPCNVPSIMYRWNGHEGGTTVYRLRVIQDRATTKKAPDLNDVPIPARELFDYLQYSDHARGFVEPQTGAMFSRGCPGKCKFCGAAETTVRWRNLDNVLQEMHQVADMGIKNVFVMDDTYTVNRARILDLSRRLQEEGISDRLTFQVQLRLDQIDPEVCDALYASGVRYVGPGIESGNQAIIDAIGKGPKESRQHMLEKVRMLQQYDWHVRCSYVLGMTDETEQQMRDTIEFAKILTDNPGMRAKHENAFTILVPYPDSPLWHVAKERGIVTDDMDFKSFLYYEPFTKLSANLSAVPTARIQELQLYAYEVVGNPAYSLDKTSDMSTGSGDAPFVPAAMREEYNSARQA